VQVIDPLQNALHTTHDPMQGGRLLSSSDANGGITRYGYDSGGFLNTVTDPLGDVTTTGHDVRGNEISKTVCQDQAAYQCSTSYTTYWPDDVSAKLSPDPRDDLRASTRDGRSASPSDPAYMTQYAYDGNGNVTAVIDPLGRKATSTYSAGTETPLSVSLATSGAASCMTSSGSGTIPAGLLISKKTPGGGTTSYAYYANGDLAQTISPLGDRVIDVYDGIGRVLFKTECSDTYPNGVVTAYTYDGDGRTQTEVDPATTDAVGGAAHQKTTTTGYTLDGQIDHTTVSDSGGSTFAADKSRTTSYTYYPTGLVDTVTDPNGAVTTDSYDVEGDKTGEQDPNGDAWQYTYNGTGQRTSTVLTNYSGSASGVCQTSQGQLVKESRAYDLAGRLASVTDAMCRKTAYTYFDNGLTATVEQLDPTKTDGSGIAEAKTYDGVGHVVSDTKGNGTAVTLTTYDAAGQNVLTKVLLGNDSSGNPQYKNTQTSYDLEGHPSSVLKWQDGLTGVEQTDYIRDAAGNVTSQIVHDSNAAQAQSANLSGAWPLNDGATTTAKDGSGGNRPATVSGWTGWSSDGPSGLNGSLWADGVSGQAATSSVPVDTAKDYSVSAWAKLAVTPSGNETIAAAPGNNRGAFFLQYSKSTGGWSFLTTSADAATTTFYSATLVGAPAVGSWVHLVGVYNAESKTISLYVNGALAQTAAASAAWTSAGGVDIGTYGGNFTGKIADVQLWSRTLSQTDVNQLYNRLSPGNQGLAGSWALDDGAVTQGADSSALGHPASQTGGVSWNASHGGSAVLDGTSGYLSTAAPVLNTANSYTVAAWVNMNQPSSHATAVSQAGANMSAFYLQYSYSVKTWAFVVQGADSNGAAQATAYSSSLTPTWNTWVFLTGVYDVSAKTATLFVNGAQVASVPVTGTFNAGGPLVIGAVKTTGGALSNQVSGAVSGVSVYSKALSGGQISTLSSGGSLLAPNTTIKTHWTYDKRGMKTSMTAPMGNATGATQGSYTTYYVSDELGRVTQVQQPGITTHVSGVASSGLVVPVTWTGYDTFGDKLETEDPNGNITATAYNQDGQPTGTTLPEYTQPGTGGQTLTVSTHIDYNTDGTVHDTVDPAGNQTSYTYDQFGDVLNQTNPPISANNTPTAGVTMNQYDQDGELTQVTDPTGAVTQTAYNYLGQKSSQTAVVRQPNNNPAQNDQTTYTYDTLGDLASVTTPAPASVTTRTGYDDAGQKISSTDGAGNVTKFSYDTDGRLKWTGNPDGSWLWNDYDLAGNLTWHAEYDTTSTLVRSQSAGYDLDGNTSWTTDFMGTSTSFSYDADGNLTDQYEPTTASNTIHTSYGYDADGHRTQQTLGNTNTTIFTYNTWNLPESKIVPAAGNYTTPADSTYTTVYDQDAHPVTQSQPGGVTVTNTFDALGDLVTQSGTEPGVTSAARALAYDLDGRATNASTQDSSHNTLTSNTFTYDDRGELTSTNGNSGNSNFTYNTSGQMSSRVDASSASATNYTYDTAGRLYSVADPITNTTATYGYNAFNQVASINYNGAGGDTRTLTYDKSHRLASDTLTAASHAQVAAIDYTYNNADQETEQDTYGIGTTSSNTAVKNSYTYDQAGRITSWNNGTTTTYYGYDNDGNRTCITTNSAGCTQANSTYAYNTRDQLTGDGTHTYAYAANGTLTGVTTTATNATEAFTFDAYQQMLTDSGTTYTYDALGRTITAGSTNVAYSGKGNDPAADGATVYARDPSGTVIADSNGGYPQEAWTDVHDNLVASFGPNGTGLGRWQTFDPLGNQVSASYWSLSLGYQSGYTTGGKVNMAARWYSPTTGQFDSADSQDNIANPSSVNANPYAYANDNPLTGTDPSGHCLEDACVVEGTVVVMGAMAAAAWISQQSWYKSSVGALWDDIFGSDSTSTSTGTSTSTTTVAPFDGYVGDTWWDDFTGQADNWWDNPGLNGPANLGAGAACAITHSCNSTLTCPPTCRPLPPPPPPPPPLWQTTKNPNSPTCKATGGILCSTTTVGQANLPSIGGSNAFKNAIAASVTGLSTALVCVITKSCVPKPNDDDNCTSLGDATNAQGNIDYFPMESFVYGCRPTGAAAYYSGPASLKGGSDASYTPIGFPELSGNPLLRARGHIIANALGGSGSNPRNIFAEYQVPANSPNQRGVELKVRDAVVDGQNVLVSVRLMYSSLYDTRPVGVEYWARGSGGLTISCYIPNTPTSVNVGKC
jgi:large repetitive protein